MQIRRQTAMFASMRSGAALIAIATTVICCNGCAATAQHVSNVFNALLIKAQVKHDLADVRQDTRRALAEQEQEVLRMQAQRDVEQARLDAERRRLEMEFCLARQEQEQRQVKEKIRESVESKVAFNVQQALEVGELEVDTEALKQLLEKREQEQKQPPPVQEQKRPCPCCDQPCGCGSGHLRRFCPHCRHRPCEAEKNCGGPEMYSQLQEQPQKQPLRPAEIPMKLPVRLLFGFQQPQLEQAQIRRQPPVQEQQIPCSRCNLPPGQCRCPDSCVDPVRSAQRLPAHEGGSEEPPGLPPMPVPDAEAYIVPGRLLNTVLPPVVSASNQRAVGERELRR